MTTSEAIFPLGFSTASPSAATDRYLVDPLARNLLRFFERKGILALKQEDRDEQWYDDWLAHQAAHQVYARLLAPRGLSSLGTEFNLLRLTRFLELFAYCSPAHGYSLQVTFLGLFSILSGTNAALKREAVASLEVGGQFAFGISEKNHGSDLMASESAITEVAGERYVANAAKYYIGNANCAAMISILARKEGPAAGGKRRHAPLALFALRPGASPGFQKPRKISTLGVRAAFVGEFTLRDHELSPDDIIAEGRDAWNAVFGAVTLGKFFLGFGSIGMCEHAFCEAATHLSGRLLYNKAAIEMPHLRLTTAQAYARLAAMKLYAFRALDYVHAATADDRRYLLFTAVQKAKVSTEGVKVMSLLSECVGAKGFESDTYFELALRDVQLIPRLEGSTHINLSQTAQFIPAYFGGCKRDLPSPASLMVDESAARENPYLFEARPGALQDIQFPPYLAAFKPWAAVANVRLFARQAKALRRWLRDEPVESRLSSDTPGTLLLGECLAIIAYAQLIAENAMLLNVPAPIVEAIFHTLINDLSIAALTIASVPSLRSRGRVLAHGVVAVPHTTAEQWEFVASRMVQGILNPTVAPANPASSPKAREPVEKITVAGG